MKKQILFAIVAGFTACMTASGAANAAPGYTRHAAPKPAPKYSNVNRLDPNLPSSGPDIADCNKHAQGELTKSVSIGNGGTAGQRGTKAKGLSI
jgi:hypothetical protein